jgi:peroxiredoxin
MAATPSTMSPLGSRAPHFALADTTDRVVTLDDYSGAPGLLVMFICNHCPYVQHIRAELARFGREYTERGLGIVAISSNDPAAYPEDSPEAMRREVETVGYTFPYLFDETQEVAKSYDAVCTPDFFLYDGDRRLVYRGQFDASRPGNDVPVSGRDLRAAADAVLEGRSPSAEQKASIGCSIKWKNRKS